MFENPQYGWSAWQVEFLPLEKATLRENFVNIEEGTVGGSSKMSSKQESTAGPTAFGIKLGMSLGRSSPVEDAKQHTITVSESM